MESTSLRTIATLEALDQFFDLSHERPVWLFKHSLICSVSSAAFKELQRFVTSRCCAEDTAVLEIQNARSLSNDMARRTGVPHESPQIFLLRDGQVAWSASHWEITQASLESAAREIDLEAGASSSAK